jgi:flagellar biogenesis protein FliO
MRHRAAIGRRAERLPERQTPVIRSGMLGNGAAAGSYGDLLVTSLLVLGGVCVAAFVVVKVVGAWLGGGAFRRGRGGQLLDVIARLPLEPRRSLYVVAVAGKTLLVGTSEMGMSLLSELDGSEVRARAVPPTGFGELVKAAWQRRRAPKPDAQDEPKRPDDGASAP